MKLQRNVWLTALGIAVGLTLATTRPAQATIPYSPVPTTSPQIGPSVMPVDLVFGKEYSHDDDHEITAAGTSPDPQQIVAWDGKGGVTDGQDFTATRPDWTPDQEIDAIAARDDIFFEQLLTDEAHLVFTIDDAVSGFGPAGPMAMPLPPGGPIPLSNGQVIGGAGELSIETGAAFTPPESQGLYASLSQVNGMPLPRDIDGLELWGPDPAISGDVDKYSLDLDFLSGVSVWNASGTPYLGHADVVAAVESLLGPLMGTELAPFDNQEGRNAINLDALMVNDEVGSSDTFDADPTNGEADSIIFSIRQMIGTSGYYATGAELFVLDAAGGVGFLDHGGHVWDKFYAESRLRVGGPNADVFTVIDINGVEAVVGVPEPAGFLLLGAAMTAMVTMRRRLG